MINKFKQRNKAMIKGKAASIGLNLEKRRSVDLLVDQFWKYGYMTLKRKFGTYLPEPGKVGNFEVDVIARQKKDYAIGITLTAEEINDSLFLEKVIFLATRKTKFSNRQVELFLGVSPDQNEKVKLLIDSLDSEIKRNIRIVSLIDSQIFIQGVRKDFVKPIFI
jgi:hypothetical protein